MHLHCESPDKAAHGDPPNVTAGTGTGPGAVFAARRPRFGQRRRPCWVGPSLGCMSVTRLQPAPVRHAGHLSPTEAWELLSRDARAMLVDVRTPAEWTFVGVPDVSSLGRELVTVPWTLWPDGTVNPHFLAQLQESGADRASAVVFLCRSGVRSHAAASAATQAGLRPAYNVRQGFEGDRDAEGHRGRTGWRADGLPWTQS